MNTAGDVIFFLQAEILLQPTVCMIGKDAMFPIIVSFHLEEQLGKSCGLGRFSSASHRRLMGAHHGVQPAVQKHIEEGFVAGIGVIRAAISAGSSTRSLRPGRSAPPVNHRIVFGLYAEVFLKHSPYPNRGGHVVFRKADFFPRQLLAAHDLAVGPDEQGGVTKTPGCKNRQRHVFSPAFVPQHRVTRHRHLRYVVRRRFDHLPEKFVGWGHVLPRQLNVVGRVSSVQKLAEIRVIDGGHV